MRLALALGHVNVDRMLEQITLEQFYEWMWFEAMEPFGYPAEDGLTARQMWASIKAFAGKDWKGKPQDFELHKPPAPAEPPEVDPVEWLHAHIGGELPPRPEPEPESRTEFDPSTTSST